MIYLKAEPKESGERGLGSFGGLKWRDRMAQKELNKRQEINCHLF